MRIPSLVILVSLLATPVFADEVVPPPPTPTPEVVAPAPAPAPVPVPAADLTAAPDLGPAPKHLLVGLKAGGIFPQPFTALSTNLLVGLEVGYMFKPAHNRLGIVLAIEYTQPPADGGGSDARVPTGAYSWSITQRELGFALMGIYRLNMFGSRVIPYGELGPKLFLMQTTVNGAAGGQAFGEQTEQSTKLGGVAAGGVDIKLGPGTILAELQLGITSLDHIITGDVTDGTLALRVGYRLWF